MTYSNDVKCPKCGASEEHPNGKSVLIRAYKFFDSRGTWSQCLVCAGYYNSDLTAKPIGTDGINPDYDHKAGWFVE